MWPSDNVEVHRLRMVLQPGVASYGLNLPGYIMLHAWATDGSGNAWTLGVFNHAANLPTRQGEPREIWWDGNRAVVWPVPIEATQLEMTVRYQPRVLPISPAWRQQYEREFRARGGKC